MGRLAILLPLLALLVMSAHSALGTPLESTFIATQGDTLAVGGRGQLAHDPNVLQELLWDLEAAKPAACRTTRLPPRRQLTVQTDNLFAWNNGIFLLGVGAVSQNGSVGVLNNTIIDPALLANQSGLFLAPGTPGIPPAVLTYLPPSVTLAAVRLNLADLKTKGYTPPANIPPRLNISIPPGAIIDPAQNPSYNLSLLDVSNIRTVSVVWATWSQQIPYALSPNASSNTTSLQVS